MQFNGNTYTFPESVQTTMPGEKVERAPADFVGFANLARTNGVVDACMSVRQSVFSATRFQWQRLNNGSPSTMFGTPDLAVLERPWPGGTTQDLLARMIQDADLCGNSYWTLSDGELIRLRPDWVDIVVEPRFVNGGIVGYKLAGYIYSEGGRGGGIDPVPLLAHEVAHFAPKPDPLATFRGMSWLTPTIRETQNDNLMSGHKRRYLENAATPNMVVSLAREVSPEAFEKFVSRMDSSHKGTENAGKTLYIGGGADVTVVGSDFKGLDFSEVQGAGETRIAAAAGVPPIIVGLSEGLKAATYSNYGQARRRFADGTIHPLWQNAAGTLETLVRPSVAQPSGVRLWYDSRNVPFLREDQREASEILQNRASAIRQLTDAGFTADSVVLAIESDDLSLLQHSGLFSVQLLPPDKLQPSTEPEDSPDG